MVSKKIVAPPVKQAGQRGKTVAKRLPPVPKLNNIPKPLPKPLQKKAQA